MRRLWLRTLTMLVLAALALGVSLVVLSLAPRGDESNATQLTKTEIEQRAIAVAQQTYRGTPDAAQVQSSTIGELQTVECGALGKWVSTLTESLRGRPNWCMPDTRVWVVTLRGNFSQYEFTTDTLTVLFDSSGGFMSLHSGELVQSNW